MVEGLLLTVVAIAAVNLIVAIRALRSSSRAEELGESRRELLRDQQGRLELLREERRTLIEALERDSREHRQAPGNPAGGSSRLAEELEYERERHLAVQQQVERQEQEHSRLQGELQRLQESLEKERREHSDSQQAVEQSGREHEDRLTKALQEAERSEQDRHRLAEALEEEREGRVDAQRRAERQEQELARLEQELQQSKATFERRERPPVDGGDAEPGASHPWWRRPLPVVGLLIGVLVTWFVSLIVALSLLAP